MLFNSYIFLLLFLPLVLCGYFLMNRLGWYRGGSLFLLGMSLWFYGYFNPSYLPLILVSVFLNYLFYKLLQGEHPEKFRGLVLAAALTFNIGLLIYFKYYDFFLENVNALFGTDFTLRHLLLPLGISFFTFQQLSFVIDSYRRKVPDYDFLNYAVFVTYFPQLSAGPISTHDELVPQFMDPERRRLRWENMAKGLYLLALGMAKKLIIADTFGSAVNWGFSQPDALNTIEALIVTLGYSIQVYFDFSSYCDMAHGIGWMMNIQLPHNFNSPYKAVDIVDFWSRWHMTLTRFFTRYIYIPLGGNRRGVARTYFNTLVVFLVSGLWHGANWTFILWGAMHGVMNVLTKAFRKYIDKLPRVVTWFGTFLFVNVAFLFFRADSIADAVQVLSCIFRMELAIPAPELLECFGLPELMAPLKALLGWGNMRVQAMICMPGFFLTAYLMAFTAPNTGRLAETFRPTGLRCLATVLLLVWCIFSISGISTFLYFNF